MPSRKGGDFRHSLQLLKVKEYSNRVIFYSYETSCLLKIVTQSKEVSQSNRILARIETKVRKLSKNRAK